MSEEKDKIIQQEEILKEVKNYTEITSNNSETTGDIPDFTSGDNSNDSSSNDADSSE